MPRRPARRGRRPARGAALFFWGVCTCRAGPMCPAEKCVPGGGAHGPRPTGRCVEPRVGDGVLDVPSARQRRAVIARRVAPRQSVFLFWGDGFPRQSADWLGMTGSRGGRLCPSHQRGAVAIRPPPANPPSKSQQFPTKFCAPLQNMKISPETVADGLRRCYIRPIHRKYTIYGHPWVSRFAAVGGKADGVFAKSNFT